MPLMNELTQKTTGSVNITLSPIPEHQAANLIVGKAIESHDYLGVSHLHMCFSFLSTSFYLPIFFASIESCEVVD